uniref:Uncharacterized protein n=1 Tax=Linum usitatissimum TaxID=4006 RepID=A0A172MLA0_LINUS|nr:hypothetical protein [Linum usitatissimum]
MEFYVSIEHFLAHTVEVCFPTNSPAKKGLQRWQLGFLLPSLSGKSTMKMVTLGREDDVMDRGADGLQLDDGGKSVTFEGIQAHPENLTTAVLNNRSAHEE